MTTAPATRIVTHECKYAKAEAVYQLEGTSFRYWLLKKWRLNGGRWHHVKDNRVKSVAGFKAWMDYHPEDEHTCRECGKQILPENDGYGTESGLCQDCGSIAGG